MRQTKRSDPLQTRDPDLNLRRLRRYRSRQGYDKYTRHALDQHFLLAFSHAVQHPSQEALSTLHQLLEAGATTDAFEDYELCQHGNFAIAYRRWLEGTILTATMSPQERQREALIFEAFACAIEAGDAFATNRAYVGNGGTNVIYWMFEWLLNNPTAQHEEHPRILAVERLFHKMCAISPYDGYFWRELQESIWRPFWWWRSDLELPSPTQERVFRFIFGQVLEPELLTQTLNRWSGETEQGWRSLLTRWGSPRAHLSPAYLNWLWIPFLEKFERREAPFDREGWGRALMPAGIAGLDAFLSSPSRRHTLLMLLGRFPRLRETLFAFPPLIFRLVAQRERRIITQLMEWDREALLAMRDEEGSSLLLHACRCRGRIERIIKLLLRSGFDPEETNDEGLDALALAETIGDPKVLRTIRDWLSGDHS